MWSYFFGTSTPVVEKSKLEAEHETMVQKYQELEQMYKQNQELLKTLSEQFKLLTTPPPAPPPPPSVESTTESVTKTVKKVSSAPSSELVNEYRSIYKEGMSHTEIKERLLEIAKARNYRLSLLPVPQVFLTGYDAVKHELLKKFQNTYPDSDQE